MNSNERSSAAPALAGEDDDIDVTGVGDDFRYAIMRGLRLGLQLVLQVSMLVAGGLAIGALMADRPGLALLAVLDWPVAVVLMYAIGTPYRYETSKPGLLLRRCGKCQVTIPDEWACPNCKEPRTVLRALSSVAYGMSFIVTAGWFINDLASFGLLKRS